MGHDKNQNARSESGTGVFLRDLFAEKNRYRQ